MASENSTSAPVAIVTGAGQGLGKAIALKLVSDGYSVILADLSIKQETLLAVQQECKKIQGNLPPQPNRTALIQFCDVRVEEEVEELVNTAVKKLGGLDVMVANAGVAKIAPLIDTTGDDIDTMHSINVKGLFYCYRAAARVMIPAGAGKIIGACSVAAKFELPLFGAYSMSKAAVRSLTHTAAREWAPHGITVNAYAPGAVDTNMWTQDVMGGNKEHPIDAKALEITPTGKKSTPEQIAALVSFFLSPAAHNITGQCISIDGGIHMD